MYTGEVTCQESQFFHWVSKAPCIFITVSIDQEAEETCERQDARMDKSFALPSSVLPRDCFQGRKEVPFPGQSHLMPYLVSWVHK